MIVSEADHPPQHISMLLLTRVLIHIPNVELFWQRQQSLKDGARLGKTVRPVEVECEDFGELR